SPCCSRSESALEALRSNPKRFKEPQKILFVETQGSCCGGAVSLSLGQRSHHQLSPIGVHGVAIQNAVRLRFRQNRNDSRWQIVWSDLQTLTQNNSAFYDIGQFANISWPIISG